METLLIAGGILLLLIVAGVWLGWLLPRTYRSQRHITLQQPPEKVFAALVDYVNHPRWYPDLDQVEALPNGADGKPRWRLTEHAASERVLVELEREPPKRVVWQFEDLHGQYAGRWHTDLETMGSGTRVTTAQALVLPGPVARATALLMGRSSHLELFLGALATHFGEKAAVER